MADELHPGALGALFARMAGETEARSRIALVPIAEAIIKRAKSDLSRQSHTYGTRTPASPGGPPAKISGTLMRSVTRTNVERTTTGWKVHVGPAAGRLPPYPKSGKRTEASEYGWYLEKGLRTGEKYPWLMPAFHYAVTHVALGVYVEVFGSDWKRAV